MPEAGLKRSWTIAVNRGGSGGSRWRCCPRGGRVPGGGARGARGSSGSRCSTGGGRRAADPGLPSRPHDRDALPARPPVPGRGRHDRVAVAAPCRRVASSASPGPGRSWSWPPCRGCPMTLPRTHDAGDRRRLRGRRADAGAALRPPHGGPLRGAARAVRVGRAAPLPVQAARPAPARHRAFPTPPGSTCCGRSALTNGVSGRFDPGLPVIALSGNSSEPDRVRGLERAPTTTWRSRSPTSSSPRGSSAVLRRRETPRSGPLRVGELCVDPVTARGARRRAASCALANKEFELLRALASEPSGCSPSRSCFGTSGASARWAGPAPSTRTRAGCAASSTRSTGGSSRTSGASATGWWGSDGRAACGSVAPADVHGRRLRLAVALGPPPDGPEPRDARAPAPAARTGPRPGPRDHREGGADPRRSTGRWSPWTISTP